MSNPSIDAATFEQLKTDLGEDFIVELVGTYTTETPELIESLEKSLAGMDAETFRRSAHSIKSSSAAMGAMQLSEQARRLEMIGKSGDLSDAASQLAGLAAEYKNVEKDLTELLNGN